MSQRILVFEKNANFLRDLETGFGRMGQETEVGSDVEAAVAAAKAGRVSLVLVSLDAMGAPGEAFLVCKRFKSDDDLARIPFVLMGGPAHAESLASHRKLKRKADQYVELPVSFESLLAQIEPVLPFDVNFRPEAEPVPSKDASSMAVDADIDAFADSAFDDLLLDEVPASEPASTQVSPPPAVAPPLALHQAPPPAPLQAPPPAPPTVDRAMERELARVTAELEEAKSQAAAAEERALSAERRAKQAEASRQSVAPPSAGVSSRDYLELREQLNRKDKELLGLRDEVTSRDRRLLDASDRTLQLEREKAEQDDAIESVNRKLEEALAKVAGYEVDLDAAKKRRDELSARLTRAEENGRGLERELDSARTSHTSEIGELKGQYEQQVRSLEEQAAADSARLRAEHAAAAERMSATHADELEREQNRAKNELASANVAHERALADAHASHARAIEELEGAQAEALSRAAAAREQALAEQKSASDASLAAALAQASDDHAVALATAAADQAERLEQKLSEAEAAKNSALEGLRNELETRFAGQAKEREDRHNKELAVLGRKLTEADGKAAALNQRIEQLEREKAELEQHLLGRIAGIEADLSRRTEERDLTQNELAAARARIVSLEDMESTQSHRIAGLESGLFQAEQRIERQSSKIATDDQILERVRKALGISIGLLEEQRGNASDN
jgi:chromosome segregation ATPase